MLTIELMPGLVRSVDDATGLVEEEPAVVAIDSRTGLPTGAGWSALCSDQVAWPVVDLLAGRDDTAQRETRMCLLRHLVRQAVGRRSWWERFTRPEMVVVLPHPIDPVTTQRIVRDAEAAGARPGVRVAVAAVRL